MGHTHFIFCGDSNIEPKTKKTPQNWFVSFENSSSLLKILIVFEIFVLKEGKKKEKKKRVPLKFFNFFKRLFFCNFFFVKNLFNLREIKFFKNIYFLYWKLLWHFYGKKSSGFGAREASYLIPSVTSSSVKHHHDPFPCFVSVWEKLICRGPSKWWEYLEFHAQNIEFHELTILWVFLTTFLIILTSLFAV